MQRNTEDTTTQSADGATHQAPEVTSDEPPATRLRPEERREQATSMQTSEIKGKAVLSIATGMRLGRVEEALLDPASLDLAALRVSASGQQAIVPFDQVQSIGRDAVMVAGDDVAQWITTSSAADGLVTVDDLKHHKVVDDAGTLLGTPQSVAVEPQSGRLHQLEVHSGGMLGMGGQTTTVAGGDVTGVGADVIVVRTSSRPA
jgi:sporulation protein YlmC with PRC-barrel domain